MQIELGGATPVEEIYHNQKMPTGMAARSCSAATSTARAGPIRSSPMEVCIFATSTRCGRI